MLDILWEIGTAVVEFLTDNGTEIFEVISAAALIAGTVYVANLTVDEISKELSKRQELKNKGAKSAIVKFIRDNDSYTEVDLDVLNADNKQIGTVTVKGKNTQNLSKGQKIPLNC